MNELLKSPGHLIRRLLQINETIFSQEHADVGLTPVQYGAIKLIRENPGVDATNLSTLLFLDKSTLGGVIERLEAKDLIMRGPSEHDKRVKLLYITSKGEKLYTDIQPSIRAVEERMIAPLAAEDRIAFMRLMNQLVHMHGDTLPHSLRPPAKTRRRRGSRT